VTPGGGVLVIDDEAAVRTLLRLNLEQEGYTVREAPDADTGVALARQSVPDLILLDIQMPNKDGWAVLTALRGDPVLCDVPVVMLTGIADEATEWRARELGAVAYVTKPVATDDLVRVVGRVTSSRRID